MNLKIETQHIAMHTFFLQNFKYIILNSCAACKRIFVHSALIHPSAVHQEHFNRVRFYNCLTKRHINLISVKKVIKIFKILSQIFIS